MVYIAAALTVSGTIISGINVDSLRKLLNKHKLLKEYLESFSIWKIISEERKENKCIDLVEIFSALKIKITFKNVFNVEH